MAQVTKWKVNAYSSLILFYLAYAFSIESRFDPEYQIHSLCFCLQKFSFFGSFARSKHEHFIIAFHKSIELFPVNCSCYFRYSGVVLHIKGMLRSKLFQIIILLLFSLWRWVFPASWRTSLSRCIFPSQSSWSAVWNGKSIVMFSKLHN